MKALGQVVDSTVWFLLSMAGLILVPALFLWPASFWLDVDSIKAGPATAWNTVPVVLDRTIKRPFYGQWDVSVKEVTLVGLVPVCIARGATSYNPDTSLPPTPTMRWLTDGACQTLPSGTYLIDVTWRIRPSVSWLPEKQVTRRSNIFEVSP